MNKLSEYLYARPSFIEGIARLFDISGSLNEYNDGLTPEQSDALALMSDWLVVGDDLGNAVLAYQNSVKNDNNR